MESDAFEDLSVVADNGTGVHEDEFGNVSVEFKSPACEAAHESDKVVVATEFEVSGARDVDDVAESWGGICGLGFVL